jgi:uncharacterized Tic20 family protein
MSFEMAPAAATEPAAEPTKDERLLAMLAHLLALFGGGFMAPLVILIVKRDSKFVAFHAIQALLICIAWVGVLIMAFLGTVGAAIAHAPHPASRAHPAAPPSEMLFLFPILFLGFAGWVVTAIVLAARANAGHWSAVPGFGWLARKLANQV